MRRGRLRPHDPSRSRMGTMLRRNSSALAFARPAGPFRSESKSSLKIDAAPAPSTSEAHAAPSPVPESPAREAAAEAAPQHIGPSPLAQETQPTPESSSVTLSPGVAQEPQPQPAPVEAPSEAPTATKSENVETAPAPTPTPAPAPAPEPAPVSVAEPERVAPQPEPTLERQTVSPEPVHEELPHAPEAPVAAPEPITTEPEPTVTIQPVLPQERGADAFSWSDGPGIVLQPSAAAIEAISAASVPAPELAPAPAPVVEEIPVKVEEPGHAEVTRRADTFAWGGSIPSSRVVSPKQSTSSLGMQSHQEPIVASPEMLSTNISRKGSRSSLASSYGQVVVEAAGRRVAVSMDSDSYTEPKRGRSRASSIRVSFNKFEDPYTDPFADPPEASAAHRALSPIDSVVEPESAVNLKMPSPKEYPSQESTPTPTASMPLPQHEYADPIHVLQPLPQPAQEQFSEAYSPPPVVMSLPPAESVIGSHNHVQKMPSAYSLGESRVVGHTDHNPLETDERLPLLTRGYGEHTAGSTSKSAVSQPNTSKGVAIAFPIGNNTSLWPTPSQSLQALGWSEVLLPDSSVYYVNRGMRITTDIELRNARKLEAITEYLDRKLPEEVALPPQGWELWLKDAGSSKGGFAPARSWVNHKARLLSFDPPPSANGEADTAVDHVTDDDRLDMEFRYWSFLESHPAHAPLPENAHNEALDALTWSYTDTLLPTEQHVPPPFSPQECQELMGLLRSFSSDSKTNPVVHTRVVARVLLRIVQWRQHYFRPNKPLPHVTSKVPLHPDRRQTFRRFFLDIIMSILCLGLPYLFIGRAQHQRIDEEGGVRSPGPMVMVGACACLVSAVILSASVTFMTLPGLDDVARLAGLIAILFSASSMVSSVVALFRWKADVERTVVYVGGEGLTLLTKRSIVMSLPLVFLAWAIAAFVTGITFYSFRGATITSRIIIKQPFEDYTHWAVVGTLGGLAGVLIMTLLLARR